LKLTVPGVPDIYQGNEIWDFSLVDPDNRRAVDYARRREMLDLLQGASPADLLEAWPDGRIKLFLTRTLLLFRRDHPDFFQNASYSPLATNGAFSECCVGFVREWNGKWIAALTTRLSSRLGSPPIGDCWQDTSIELPESLDIDDARQLFTERILKSDNRTLRLSEAMAELPFALYTSAGFNRG
jgi:(1->4)-alpha-D-glucan 1-alpha-D-glucosylmutase